MIAIVHQSMLLASLIVSECPFVCIVADRVIHLRMTEFLHRGSSFQRLSLSEWHVSKIQESQLACQVALKCNFNANLIS